jgi:hypothetical protein
MVTGLRKGDGAALIEFSFGLTRFPSFGKKQPGATPSFHPKTSRLVQFSPARGSYI